MLSVITFKYFKPGYRTVYTSGHVNALARMVEQKYPHPHRFICFTNEPDGIASNVEVKPMWDTHMALVNPTHPTNRPNCYPRLRTFAADFGEIVGPRFVSLDLDMVLTSDVSSLWNRPDDFVIYDAKGDDHYNGSMFLHTCGTRTKVWDDFDPVKSPKLTMAHGMRGSDQAWIRYCLSPDAKTWTNADGVFAYLHLIPPYRHRLRHIAVPRNARTRLPPPRDGRKPETAKVVIFAGEYKPWDRWARETSPWIDEHYPQELVR